MTEYYQYQYSVRQILMNTDIRFDLFQPCYLVVLINNMLVNDINKTWLEISNLLNPNLALLNLSYANSLLFYVVSSYIEVIGSADYKSGHCLLGLHTVYQHLCLFLHYHRWLELSNGFNYAPSWRHCHLSFKRAAITSIKCSTPSDMQILDVGILAKAMTNLIC